MCRFCDCFKTKPYLSQLGLNRLYLKIDEKDDFCWVSIRMDYPVSLSLDKVYRGSKSHSGYHASQSDDGFRTIALRNFSDLSERIPLGYVSNAKIVGISFEKYLKR